MKTFAGLSLAFVAVLSVVSNGNCEGAERATNYIHFHAYTDGGVDHNFLTYAPDLGDYNMDNAITRACHTGLWLMYANIDYNYPKQGITCVSIEIDNCFDLDCPETSSLRFAGSPYVFNEPYFNLYKGEGFDGLEFAGNRTTSSVDVLDSDVGSLIITGVASWTLFSGSDFTGPSVCVIPDRVHRGADGTVIMYGLFMTYELNLSYIGSLKQGCHSDTVVSAKAVKDKREKGAVDGK